MATVLVIEDDLPTRILIRTIVEKRGHEVWDTSNGEEGIKICRLLLPDLVITDIIMPVQGGIETMVELKAIFTGTKVIAVSGDPDKLDLALKLGARHAFLKPFSPQKLGEMVEYVLKS